MPTPGRNGIWGSSPHARTPGYEAQNLAPMKKLLSVFLGSAIVLATVLISACSPYTKVYSEEEPGINLGKYHTYDWLRTNTAQEGNAGPQWLNTAAQQKIRAEVESHMGTYGYKPCDEKPDLMLHYHVVIKNQVLYVRDWSCGGVFEGPGQYDNCNRVTPVHYREGTLILDFIDTKTNTQVWRGAAAGVLENVAPEEANARIKAAVDAIFTKYPEKIMPKATP